MSTRRDQLASEGSGHRSSRVVIQQRVHERDVTGSILAMKDHGYVHLMLPMRYDPKRSCVTVLGWQDPRTEDGELLWPSRFPKEEVDRIETYDLGAHGTAGQHQQLPTARSGGQFERQWFPVVDSVPRGSVMVLRVRYWDKAGTAGGGAYTTGLLMGLRNDGLCYVEDVIRGQWAAADRERIIRETAEMDAMRYGVYTGGELEPNRFEVLYMVEQEPGSGGKDSAEATVRNLAGFRIETERPTGDKFTRADPLAGAAKNGDVLLVRGAWNEAFLREMEAAGPGAAYLDQMDTASGAYNRLQREGAGVINVAGLVLEEFEQVSPHAIY
jgi:predicted phage terminase large subunit-like protein